MSIRNYCDVIGNSARREQQVNIGRSGAGVRKTVAAVAVAAAVGMSVLPAAQGQSAGQSAGQGGGMSVGPGAVVAENQFTAEVTFSPRGNTWWPVTGSSQDITYRLRNTGSSSTSGKVTVMVDQMFSRQTKVGEERSFTLSPGQTLTGSVRSDIAPELIMRPTISVKSSSGSPRVSITPDTPQWVVPWGVVLAPLLVVVAVVAGWLSWKRNVVSGE